MAKRVSRRRAPVARRAPLVGPSLGALLAAWLALAGLLPFVAAVVCLKS